MRLSEIMRHLMEPITTLSMALKKMIFEKNLLGSSIKFFF
jgi:hypothetical protein